MGRCVPRGHRGVACALLVAATLVPCVPARAAAIDAAPPATIRVCRSTGGVDVVPFRRYVEEVLPRELYPSWPVAALRAGAVAIKSYAWFHVEHPYSSRCDLTDTTRHQKYCPECSNPPTAKTNRAVADIWQVRFEDAGRDTIAYAQYCSGSVCSRFPDGRHIDQWESKSQADQGWTWEEIIRYHYRAMPPRLLDWRAGLGLDLSGRSPYAFGEGTPLTLTAQAVGIPAGDPRAVSHLYAHCDTGDGARWRPLATGGVVALEDGPGVRWADPGVLPSCVEHEVVLSWLLTVNGYEAATGTTLAWRPWTTAEPRAVERIADTDDPVAGSVAISRRLFRDAAPGPDPEPTAAEPTESAPTEAEPTPPEDPRRAARTVVVVRSDAFADALTATALAGVDAPVLLTPGGPDGALAPEVAREVERILRPGSEVLLVGGEGALSPRVAADLEDLGLTVRRLFGATRIDTAVAVAERVRETGGATQTVLIARAYPDTSRGWADAITAGAYAATRRHPILLTTSDGLDPRVEGYVTDPANDVTEAVILGGPAAVPVDAEQRLAGVATSRVAGPARDGTATAIADQLWTRSDAPPVAAVLVVDGYGDGDWPFALTSAIYAANLGAPQLLTHQLVPRGTTGAWLDARPGLPVVVVGGPGIVRSRIDADLSGS